MMADMGAMVTEQGEAIDVVEVSVDAARAGVSAGNADLERASEYQASYRRKVCMASLCVLALLAAIIIPLVIHYLPNVGGGGGGGGAPSPSPMVLHRALEAWAVVAPPAAPARR